MQPKRDNQGTFFELAVQQRGASNPCWKPLPEAEQRISARYATGGRPACRVGVLLRSMILQHLYGLSDPQAEEQLKDRLSFQKFVQYGLHPKQNWRLHFWRVTRNILT
jgi:hypothetical protein